MYTARNALVVDTRRSPHARLQPVSVNAVLLSDEFWTPRLQRNREISLPAQFQQLEQTGRLDNFRRVTRKKDVPFQGYVFNDSDVYKWLEAAAWALAASGNHPDLGKMVDIAVGEIAGAQESDGYLNTYFTFERASQRWSNLRDQHELYCAGHLIQAAIALRRATGDERLFDVARRFADHICDTFGAGKRPGVPGHPEIEMALVELARESGEANYREQARYFIDQRGRGLIGGSPYHQDHRPLREMHQLVGHAVRALYLCAGAADLYAETGEPELLSSLERLWEHMVARQMYISGGLGARHEGEAFGEDYELPNTRAYTETCAAIASVMWNWRMLQLTGEARYADAFEQALFNAVLPGISLDGLKYFYENPLASRGTHCRQAWFPCACCPPNIARLLASLPGYLFSASPEGIWVHLYAQGRVQCTLPDGQQVGIYQTTRYPWEGDINLQLESTGLFGLFLRVPGWAEGASVDVNGLSQPVAAGSYVEIRREWHPGDRVGLHLPVKTRLVESHPYVLENSGRVAVLRGPLLYCAEGVDNPGIDLSQATFEAEVQPSERSLAVQDEHLVALTLPVKDTPVGKDWEGRLYRPVDAGGEVATAHPYPLTFIPYFAWANRDAGPMQVWMRKVFGS
jgi:DUF1680 family protein